jgi:hypothetical protein
VVRQRNISTGLLRKFFQRRNDLSWAFRVRGMTAVVNYNQMRVGQITCKPLAGSQGNYTIFTPPNHQSRQKNRVQALYIARKVFSFAAGNVRYGGNSRKHLLVARFSQFDPNQTWRFRVSPQMSSGVFSRIASTSTVIRRGRTGVLSRLHVGARLARAAHLPPVQRCHLLFDPSTEGLHMRMLRPALWADEVICPARAQGEPNWHHESPRA